jgi:hypothetical protein
MQIHILEMVRKHNTVLGVGTWSWQKVVKKVFKCKAMNIGLLKKDVALLVSVFTTERKPSGM